MSLVHPSRWDRLRVAAVLRASADPGPIWAAPHDRDRWLQAAARVEGRPVSEPELIVEIDGVIWRANDIGVDANGLLVQLLRYNYSSPTTSEAERWHWAIFDSEYNWEVWPHRPREDGDPLPPFRKMRLVPVEETS